MADLTKGKSNRSHKLHSKYENHFDKLAARKARRMLRRREWLARRQSPEVRDRMNVAWSKRHPFSDSKRIIVVQRYGLPCPINPKPREAHA